jgi:hypothetical protein
MLSVLISLTGFGFALAVRAAWHASERRLLGGLAVLYSSHH